MNITAYNGILSAQRGRDPQRAMDQWSYLTRVSLERSSEDVIELTAALAAHFGRWALTIAGFKGQIRGLAHDAACNCSDCANKPDLEVCIYCNREPVNEHDPYCSTACEILAREG